MFVEIMSIKISTIFIFLKNVSALKKTHYMKRAIV